MTREKFLETFKKIYDAENQLIKIEKLMDTELCFIDSIIEDFVHFFVEAALLLEVEDPNEYFEDSIWEILVKEEYDENSVNALYDELASYVEEKF